MKVLLFLLLGFALGKRSMQLLVTGSIEEKVHALELQVQKLVQERVAFSAQFDTNTDEIIDMQKHQTVVYSLVEYNFGNGYDSSTGLFQCPVSGTYVFFFNLNTERGKNLGVVLTVNGKRDIAHAYAGAADSNLSMNGSNMVIVYLNKGDQVWVRSHNDWLPTQGTILKYSENSFSGFLLYHA